MTSYELPPFCSASRWWKSAARCPSIAVLARGPCGSLAGGGWEGGEFIFRGKARQIDRRSRNRDCRRKRDFARNKFFCYHFFHVIFKKRLQRVDHDVMHMQNVWQL